MVDFASASIVLSNNASPGDDFTNPNTTITGQAVGASGWYYNNVRNNGHVGISTDLPRSGNGSVYFQGTQGPGGNSSKSDIEFLPNASPNGAGNYSTGGVLGTLANLTSLSYEWYRDASSNASDWLHPVLRLLVVDNPANPTAGGYLVFEREVNRDSFGYPPGPTNVPEDQWVADDLLNGDYRLWSTGSTLPNNLNGTNGPAKYYDALRVSEWKSTYGSYSVVGISAGIGSGWGTFEGAVDNITFGFGTAATTYNFEVRDDGVVPELSALITWGVLVLSAVFSCQRRR